MASNYKYGVTVMTSKLYGILASLLTAFVFQPRHLNLEKVHILKGLTIISRRLGSLGFALGVLITVTATNAGAATFTWTYSGAACTEAICGDPQFFPGQAMEGHGSLDAISDPSVTFPQRLLVTSIQGTWNNLPITGILPVNDIQNDNHLYYPQPVGFSSVKLLNPFGLGFTLGDNPGGTPTGVNLFWDSALGYFALTFDSLPYGFDFATGASFGTFSVQPTPLPAAFSLFATGVGALGFLARRRKRKAAVV
jgi:hypothetical protein